MEVCPVPFLEHHIIFAFLPPPPQDCFFKYQISEFHLVFLGRKIAFVITCEHMVLLLVECIQLVILGKLLKNKDTWGKKMHGLSQLAAVYYLMN